jgi:hypothetical protein
MRRRLTALLLCLALCLLPAPQAGAHDAGEHWKEIRYVLFGQERTPSSLDKDQRQKLNDLLYATQLCIDQFGGSCASYLSSLHNNHYRHLPKSISEIDLYATANDHRLYTHRGWNESYEDMSNGENPDWTQRWQQRKKLLTDVAEQIFDFDGRWSVFDVFGYPCTTECDAFCRLLYYVHLLGDHAAFTTYSYNRVIKGKQGKDQVVSLASTRGDCVISELQKAAAELFGETETSELNRELEEIKSRVIELLNGPEAMKTDEDLEKYKGFIQDILDTLAKYIPNLLKETDFFSKVFY